MGNGALRRPSIIATAERLSRKRPRSAHILLIQFCEDRVQITQLQLWCLSSLGTSFSMTSLSWNKIPSYCLVRCWSSLLLLSFYWCSRWIWCCWVLMSLALKPTESPCWRQVTSSCALAICQSKTSSSFRCLPSGLPCRILLFSCYLQLSILQRLVNSQPIYSSSCAVDTSHCSYSQFTPFSKSCINSQQECVDSGYCPLPLCYCPLLFCQLAASLKVGLWAVLASTGSLNSELIRETFDWRSSQRSQLRLLQVELLF